jgi:hypothetical protein
VVDDYKTSLWVPPADEWSAFQVKTALVAVLYGRPVDRVPCPNCDATGFDRLPGHGQVFDVRWPVLDRGARRSRSVSGWSRFEGRELYPRKDLRRDGLLHRNEGRGRGSSWTSSRRTWSARPAAARADAGAGGGVAGAEGVVVLDLPGGAECPIPAEERDHEGAVRGYDHAVLLWEWALAMKERAGKVEAVVKTWAKTHEGPDLRVGDKAWAWLTSETRRLKRRGGSADWDGLEEAVRRAAELGEPFDLEEWVKPGRRSEFKSVKVPVERREELKDVGDAAADGDGRGDDAERDRDRRSESTRRGEMTTKYVVVLALPAGDERDEVWRPCGEIEVPMGTKRPRSSSGCSMGRSTTSRRSGRACRSFRWMTATPASCC